MNTIRVILADGPWLMLQTSDTPPLKQNELVFLLAIAGRIDAQDVLAEDELRKAEEAEETQKRKEAEELGKKKAKAPSAAEQPGQVIRLAKEFDKSNHVYKAYAVLDSLSSSYSMFKYFFDVCIGGSADDMHNLMLTPGGIAGIAVETIFLVGFSFLACHFDKEKEDNWKKRLADAWPYCRDILKGLKNAYKGWRSSVAALKLLHIVDANALIMPVGIVLGVLAAANRYFMRTLTETRKAMMIANAELLIELKTLDSLTAEEAEVYYDQENSKNSIKYQTTRERYLGYLCAGVGGFVDGLYLYVSVLGLATLVPPLLIAMAALCAFYALACIITRLYEERDFQLRLMVTQTKCDLVILTKRIQTCYAELLLLEETPDKTEDTLLKIQKVKKEISELIVKFDTARQLLKQQTGRSYFSALLLGLRNGLYAYNTLSSILFFVSTFLTLASVAFPPAAIAVAVCLGLAFFTGFIVHALVENYQHRKKQEPVQDESYNELLLIKERFAKEELEAKEQEKALLTTERLNESLKEGLSVEPAPTHLFQEWFEVFRSLFSGLGKGQKFAEFAGNSLQEVGSDGHYHDTPVMFVLGGLSALLFGAVLGLRALAKGIGRAPLGAANDLATAVLDSSPKAVVAEVQEEGTHALVHPEQLQTQVSGESNPLSKRKDSPKSSESFLAMTGFFKLKTSSLVRSQSDKSLNSVNNLIELQHKVGGLN